MDLLDRLLGHDPALGYGRWPDRRLGLSDLPEIDHALWDFVQRGVFQG